ncbi:MAG TPA: arginine--tRNA ligase [Candidatus Acidoferrum sp.]|nr:arginine--tRNA ligase [Candidatus Acidoferrum sp.]
MYLQQQQKLAASVRAFLREKYSLDLANIVIDQPPNIEMGEFALPLSFELAKRLRKPPRKIAEEIVAGLPLPEGFEKLGVAGAGYINARLKRDVAARALAGDTLIAPLSHAGEGAADVSGKILVEHTSINPNKAAHIGHLRNAILGDSFVRLLRAAGHAVDVQNYIDNTGVQVADVVVGFVLLEKKSQPEIAALIPAMPRFDYYCWDLYARVSQWYGEDKDHLKARSHALHAIEQGGNELAEIAELISTAVLRRHLETMDRLDIEYDFLPRESEILHLYFWESAFELLKQKGVLYFETEGKNKGCWVMKRPKTQSLSNATKTPAPAKEASTGHPAETTDDDELDDLLTSAGTNEGLDVRPTPTGPDEDAKVIVRSNGTVGYVGKDIAYHLWKFGLLGRDFGYRRFYRYPNQHEVWISAAHGEPGHPHFGGVEAIYNVIDSRQSDPQNTVIEAIRLLGYTGQAEHYTHFSYEMVALTPRCALDLGYEISEEDRGKSYIEVSGRRGFGVKADDLLDALIAAAKREVDSRHAELSDEERSRIATQIAIGALRYFMLKFTKQSVIAFDFKEALAFEGETGPYAQYAVVRATNIFRKAGVDPEQALAAEVDYARHFADASGTEIWELWLLAGKTSYVIEQCIATTEPAFAAKHAFQLAQQFNNFYHRHHILTESDEDRKRFLLATAAVVRRELMRVLAVMGISVPSVM